MASMWLPEFDPDLVLVHTGLNDAFTVGYPDEGGPDNTEFRHVWTYRPPPNWIRRAMKTSHFIRLAGKAWLSKGGYGVGDMSTAMQLPVPPKDEVLRNARRATGRYFRRNLETIIALVRNSGAEPVLVNLPLNPLYEQGKGVYYDAVSQAVLRNNRIMDEVGARNGLIVVDLYSRMRAPAVFLDAAHVNEEGMWQKAQYVFEAIEPRVKALGKRAPALP
jgi:hypothetical protein